MGTWTDSTFIAGILRNLNPSANSEAHPSYQFDNIYMDILSDHPLLLQVLHTKLVFPRLTFTWGDLEVPGCTRHVFQPLCALNGLLLDCSFPLGDSPLDFLSDFHRAGTLYEESYHTAEKAVIHWIRFVKALVNRSDI